MFFIRWTEQKYYLYINSLFLDSSPNKIAHVTSAHLNPFPVVVPGDLTGDIVVQAPRLVEGNHYKLDVHIQKHALFWITVPCISNVGSWYTKTFFLKNIFRVFWGFFSERFAKNILAMLSGKKACTDSSIINCNKRLFTYNARQQL